MSRRLTPHAVEKRFGASFNAGDAAEKKFGTSFGAEQSRSMPDAGEKRFGTLFNPTSQRERFRDII